MDRYLSTSQVAQRLGWTVNALNARIRAADNSEDSEFPPFPPPDVVIGDRYQGWKDSTIDAYEREMDRSVRVRPSEAAPIINALRACAEVIRTYGSPPLSSAEGIGKDIADVLHQYAAVLESMVRGVALTDFNFYKVVEAPAEPVAEHLTLDVLPVATPLIYPAPSADECAAQLRSAAANITNQVAALASAVDSYAGRTLGKKLVGVVADVERYAESLVSAEPATHLLSEIGPAPSFLEFAGLGEDLDQINVRAEWDRREGEVASRPLHIPLGPTPERTIANLYIGDRNIGGFGAHGMVVGSEPSETASLLVSLIYSGALRYSPAMFSVVYVDPLYEPEAADLEGLPHTSIAVSDLNQDHRISRRVIAALSGELKSRYSLFKSVGARDHVHYEQMRRETPDSDLNPVPIMLLIVNNFSTLIAEDSAWGGLLAELAQMGRGAGFRLMLVGKRALVGPSTVATNLGYRIALRVDTPEVSRDLIGTDAAIHLREGRAILAPGARDLVAFQGVPVSAGGTATTEGKGTGMEAVRVIDVLRDKMIQAAGVVPPTIWLPPLETSENIDDLVSRWRGQPWDENYSAAGEGMGALPIVVGLEDDPYHARQYPHVLDLARTSAVVVGAEGMGKSNALRVLVQSGCLTYRPGRVSFMCIGEQLTSLESWPHVVAVANGAQHSAIDRMVSTLEAARADRRNFLSEREITLNEYRAERFAAASADPDPLGDAFLIIDDADTAHLALPTSLRRRITDLATDGPAYGIHVILSHRDWIQGHSVSLHSVDARLELTLDSPATSYMDRSAARRLADSRRPGFGCTKEGHELLIATSLEGEAADTAIARIHEIMRLTGADPESSIISIRQSARPYESEDNSADPS